MSDFTDMLRYMFEDRRTRLQKIRDRILIAAIITFIISIFVGVGILIAILFIK